MTTLPIDLPEGFTSLVTVGDRVNPEQIIARKDSPKDEIVNIMEGLNLSRSQAKKTLKKNPGDQIHAGDVIAVKKNFFGKVQAKITSNISGIVLRYERDTGNLVVRTNQDASSLELISPVAGTVRLCNNKEIVIETADALVSNGVALGTTGEGTLFVLKESFDDAGSDNALYYLDNRVVGKIVLARTLSPDMLIKGDSIGAKGFLGISLSNEDIDYMQQKKIKLPVLEISDELVSKVKEWENKKIMVDIADKAIILRE